MTFAGKERPMSSRPVDNSLFHKHRSKRMATSRLVRQTSINPVRDDRHPVPAELSVQEWKGKTWPMWSSYSSGETNGHIQDIIIDNAKVFQKITKQGTGIKMEGKQGDWMNEEPFKTRDEPLQKLTFKSRHKCKRKQARHRSRNAE